LIQAHNAVLKDQELTDLEQRLKALEEREAPYKERVYE
jgi:flagellar motility protein MotE (MotC chaperone)